MTFISYGTSTGTSAHEILAPDLGLLLATEMQTWPPELAHQDTVRWIREYREHLVMVVERFQRYGDRSLDALAHHALNAALLWRVDICVKLLIHIGWQWTTATRLLDEIVEATTPERLETARELAREQFANLESQRLAEQAEPLLSPPESSEQPPSAVLQATDDQLDAALRSIYAKSRTYHTERLTQAQGWWPAWINEARLLQWQADLYERLDDRSRYRMLADDAGLYETLQTLESLCRPPALLGAMGGAMEKDGADSLELLAPDHALWPPTDAQPIEQYLQLLLAEPASQIQHDVITYWLAHAQMPLEVKPLAEPTEEALNTERWFIVVTPTEAETADEAPNSQPEGADLWIGSGLMQEALGQLEEALTSYARAVELLPENPTVLRSMTKILRQLRRYEEALSFYERDLALHPDDASLWQRKGEALHELGRSEEALDAFEHALALDPRDGYTLLLKADTLAGLGRFAEALQICGDLLAQDADNPITWIIQAYILLAERRYDDAIASVDRAIAIQPEEANWWDSRGEILLAAGRYSESLVAYDRALGIDPNFATSQQGRAQALQALQGRQGVTSMAAPEETVAAAAMTRDDEFVVAAQASEAASDAAESEQEQSGDYPAQSDSPFKS